MSYLQSYEDWQLEKIVITEKKVGASHLTMSEKLTIKLRLVLIIGRQPKFIKHQAWYSVQEYINVMHSS